MLLDKYGLNKFKAAGRPPTLPNPPDAPEGLGGHPRLVYKNDTVPVPHFFFFARAEGSGERAVCVGATRCGLWKGEVWGEKFSAGAINLLCMLHIFGYAEFEGCQETASVQNVFSRTRP